MPVHRRRHAGRVGDRHPGVEVDRVQTPLGRRRERQVRDRGGVDVGAAGVLDGHVQAEVDRDVAQLRGAGDAADARDLERHGVGHAVTDGAHQRRQRVDRLVEHQRHRARVAHRAALLVRRARLLEPEVDAGRGAQEPARVGRGVEAVRVGEQRHRGADRVAHGGQPLGVALGVLAELDLEPPVAAADVVGRRARPSPPACRPRSRGTGRPTRPRRRRGPRPAASRRGARPDRTAPCRAPT